MKNWVRAALVGVLCASLTGCAYRFAYRTGVPPSREKITRWKHITGWGTSSQGAVDLDEICPGEIAEFGSYISFPNWLCTFFTLGFYSPQTIYVIPGEAAKRERGGAK